MMIIGIFFSQPTAMDLLDFLVHLPSTITKQFGSVVKDVPVHVSLDVASRNFCILFADTKILIARSSAEIECVDIFVLVFLACLATFCFTTVGGIATRGNVFFDVFINIGIIVNIIDTDVAIVIIIIIFKIRAVAFILALAVVTTARKIAKQYIIVLVCTCRRTLGNNTNSRLIAIGLGVTFFIVSSNSNDHIGRNNVLQIDGHTGKNIVVPRHKGPTLLSRGNISVPVIIEFGRRPLRCKNGFLVASNLHHDIRFLGRTAQPVDEILAAGIGILRIIVEGFVDIIEELVGYLDAAFQGLVGLLLAYQTGGSIDAVPCEIPAVSNLRFTDRARENCPLEFSDQKGTHGQQAHGR
mmetsp:Transcript_5992/g.17045  ORF Transcript_5992/g.17045 Transcript_5992/m.17045 type:complete len:354 (-) Transcript_5992:1685-2746(-)